MKHHLSTVALILLLPLLVYSLMGDFAAFFQKDLPQSVFSNDLPTHSLLPYPTLSLSAKHAILYTEDGHIIYGKNEHDRAAPASTTKVMTALLAVEYLDIHGLDTKTVISERAVGTEGSSIYLETGETLTLLDLVYALLLASANDAAIAIAEAVSGNTEAFVDRMNEKAAALSLTSTHFENPHGLPAEGHFTTAYDLARLFSAAMQNPLFARITATRQYAVTSGKAPRHLANHNRLLSRYEPTIGGKTGFTKQAGRCLVTAAEQNGIHLYAVTLSAPDDWNDHETLYTHGFSAWEAVALPSFCHELAVIDGDTPVTVSHEKTHLILPKQRGTLDYLHDLPPFVYAPIRHGDRVGTLTVFLDGEIIATIPYTADHTVLAKKHKSFWEKLFS